MQGHFPLARGRGVLPTLTPGPSPGGRGASPASRIASSCRRRGAGTGPPAMRPAAAYWTQGGTENSPLAYFGGYTTFAVPSVYH